MTELLEMQGLTPDMVRDYLRGKGWTRNEAGDLSKAGECWRHSNGAMGTCWLHDKSPCKTVEALARMEQRHVQEVAANVNPRLRPGPPSRAARMAHRGYWLARWRWEHPEKPGLTMWSETEMDLNAEARQVVTWSFWPCDANGQRVRWPVDGNGVML